MAATAEIDAEIKRRKAAKDLLDSGDAGSADTSDVEAELATEDAADADTSDTSDTSAESDGYPRTRERDTNHTGVGGHLPNFVLTPIDVQNPAPEPSPAADVTFPTIAQDQPGAMDRKSPAFPVPKSYDTRVDLFGSPADIQTDEETGTRFVQDPELGKIPHAELATEADKLAQPPGVPMQQVDVSGNVPVRRAELIDPDPDLLYTTPLPPEGRPAPDRLTQVEKAQPARVAAPDSLTQVERGDLVSVPPGTAPKAVGRAAPVVYPTIAEDQGAPGTPPKVQPAAPVGPPTPVTPKPRFSSFGYTQEELDAQQAGGKQPTTATTTTTKVAPEGPSGTYDGPPAMNAPNGEAPSALIIHHTSGRGDAANVADGWRTERPGVGSQYIMDRDGTIHDTKAEFGYNGTGHFLHSVIPGVSNQTAVGIEVVAKDDADMTDAQLESLKRFAGPGGPYANTRVYGHSQVSPGDRDNEGVRGVVAINEARAGHPQVAGADTGADTGATKAGYINGRATTFGYHDAMDEGVGAPKLGKLSTNNTDLLGVAVPQAALERFVSQRPADWRKARVEVTTSDGKRLLVPIVDLGPHDTSNQRGVVADFTQGLTNLTGNTGEQNYQFRIIPNAGPDVTTHPQAFADEQAALKAGVDLAAPFQKGPAGKGKQPNFVLTPLNSDQATAADAANTADVAKQGQTLDTFAKKSSNLIDLYKKLDTAPPDGVSAAVVKTYQGNLQKEIVQQMQERFPDMNSDVAWKKAQEDSSLWDIGSEFGHRFTGEFAQLAPVFAQKSPDKEQVAAFLDNAVPNGSDAEKHALLTQLYTIPPDKRPGFIAAYLGAPSAGQRGNDPAAIATAMEHLADPNWQAAEDKKLADARAFAEKARSADPRLAGSLGGSVADLGAQAEQILSFSKIPIIGAAQTSERIREELKAKNPDLTEEQLDDQSAYQALVEIAGMTAANHLWSHGTGILFRSITAPYKRALANVLAGTLGNVVIGGGTQVGTNIVTGRPPMENVQQGIPGNIVQGLVPSLFHGYHELRTPGHPEAVVPRIAPPEAPPPTPTVAEVLSTHPNHPEEVHGDVLNTVAHNLFPDLSPTQAKAVADRASLLSVQNLETDRFQNELRQFLPQDVIHPFGPTKRLLQAYLAFKDGPNEYTAKEIAIAEKAYNEARTPVRAKVPVMREISSLQEAVGARSEPVSGVVGQAEVPSVPPPGPTVGPHGAPIRGPTDATLEKTAPEPGTLPPAPEVQPPPLPLEAHTDQDIEQRSAPPVRGPVEAREGMTEEEASTYLDTLSNELEARHQARAGDIGLLPSDNHPQASVHSNMDSQLPPERLSIRAPEPTTGPGVSVPEATQVVDRFREQFPGAPPINVVESRDQLPQHLQDSIGAHAGDHSVEALVHGGEIHVVAGENTSPEALHRTLLEEAVGHYGVEQVLGNKFDHLADVVSRSMAGHPDYEKLKAAYGEDPRTLAAEYIARTARGQIENPTIWAHVKTWFNQLARRLGFDRPFSDSELRVLLSKAKGRLEKGGGRAVITPRFHLEEQPEVQLRGGGAEVGKAENQLRYAGAPPGVRDARGLRTLKGNLTQLAREGEAFKDWYTEGAQPMMRGVGNDPKRFEQLMANIAATSPQNSVYPNFGMAVRGMAQQESGGRRITIGKGEMMKQRLAQIGRGETWPGVKTNQFYRDHMAVFDKRLQDDMGSTMDMHMARALGYPTDSFTPKQSQWGQGIMREITQELGWGKPKETQAAIWSAIKARFENVWPKIYAEAKANGDIVTRVTKSGTEKVAFKDPATELKYRNRALREAMKIEPPDLSGAAFNFGDALKRDLGTVSYKTRPSSDIQARNPWMQKMSSSDWDEYHKQQAAILMDPDGTNKLAKLTNLISIGDHQGYSAWGTERNLSQQITAVMPKASGIVLERAGEKWKVDPTVEKQVKDFAAATGLLYRQDGVGWHRPYFDAGATQKEANGVRINMGRDLSKEETHAVVSNLEKILPSYEEGGKKGWFIAPEENGLRIVSWGHEDGKKVYDAVRKVVNDPSTKLGESTRSDLERFVSHGNLIENNWKEQPNGEIYRRWLRARGRSDVQRLVDDTLRPQAEAIDRHWEARKAQEAGREEFSQRAEDLTRASTGESGAPGAPRGPPDLGEAIKRARAAAALGGEEEVPRFHKRAKGEGEIRGPEISRPTKEELPGKRWYSPARLAQGPRWIRSAYDELARHPHTAPLAAALMHRVDRAQELRAQWSRPIVEALRGVKKGNLKAALADFAKLQEAKDNKRPQPTGLHPDAYKIERAVRATSEQVAEIAKQNKILVFDPRLDGGKGGYRPFRAASDYVPRNVKREVIDAMRLKNNSPQDLARWTTIVHDFINKGFAKDEAEVIDNIKGAANLDTKHIDSKMGNLEKARVSRLPSNMYEYSLTGMLDYVRRASDRMSEVEAYGQRGEMFQKAVDRVEGSALKGTEQGNGLIGYIKSVRNRELGLNESTPLGKAAAITRSFAAGMDLSGWMGMVNDLIGSSAQTPVTMGVWNTAKGYMHAATHFKQMMSHAEDLGVIHDDYGRATREIEHDYQTGTFSDKLGRVGSRVAEIGMKYSGREAQEKFIRTMTLGAAKQMLRNAVDTIKANPASAKAGTWAHYLQRRGVDVSKIVAEGGQGPETNRLLRRAVADTQAGYDLIQRSPWMESSGGKFFAQYMSWGVNQTRNVMREVVLPMFRPNQKTIAVKVGDKTYMVKDSRFSAIQRGLMLAAAGTATGLLTDQVKHFFLGRINSYRDLTQLAIDIAQNPDKSAVFANMMRTMQYELLTGGMLGLVGNAAQIAIDPQDKVRFKDLLHPTGFNKIQSIWQFIKRSAQEGQFNSHEADALLKTMGGAYREGKPIVARAMSTLGYSPNWVKEERTRQTVSALRNTLRRYNDEQGLGLKPSAFQNDTPDASRNTPVAQSVVDALYRGDAAGAQKLLIDYLKSIPDEADRKKAANSIKATVQSATPLKLGSTSNKEFAQGFWDWAQKGNVTPAQIADYKKVVNAFADASFNAGFKREMQVVPEEPSKTIVIAKKVPRTSLTNSLREMIRKENAAKVLIAH